MSLNTLDLDELRNLSSSVISNYFSEIVQKIYCFAIDNLTTDDTNFEDLHIILDNYSTHKHAKVKAWLASHSRFHFHFTPTYSSWLNQVERWFALITDRAIRRGSFSNVKQLRDKIDAFITAYNKTAVPFMWTATADSIFEKISRLCSRITGTGH